MRVEVFLYVIAHHLLRVSFLLLNCEGSDKPALSGRVAVEGYS